MEKIGTIGEEEKDCRAAFAAYPNATWAWCCHHEKHFELLTEPARYRIAFILGNKSKSEQAVRLRNFRPIKDNEAMAPAVKAYKAYNEAMAPAVKAYNEALALAVKAYTSALAVKAYDEAMPLAVKAYNEALALAVKAYNEAMALAVKACDEAMALAVKACDALHNKEWPDNTWNGKSIFNL